MDTKVWFHFIWILALGYLLGYYFKGLGNATVGKLKPPAA